MAGRVGEPRAVSHAKRRPPPEILCARDVPLPVGAHPYGPCAQLRHGRRRCPVQAGARLQRAAPDGMGCVRHAGGKRRHGQQDASGDLDLRQYRDDARAAEVDGAVARLAPRIRHLRTALLQAPAADVPGFPCGRPRRPQDREGQLGPRGPDRAGQRAGHRRPRLALGRARRAARADPVVPANHPLRPGPARRPRQPRPLAREGAADAAQLDRPIRGHAGPLRVGPGNGAGWRERADLLLDAHRHAVRRQLHGDRAGPPAGPEARRD